MIADESPFVECRVFPLLIVAYQTYPSLSKPFHGVLDLSISRPRLMLVVVELWCTMYTYISIVVLLYLVLVLSSSIFFNDYKLLLRGP